jgi:hypothetical protein
MMKHLVVFLTLCFFLLGVGLFLPDSQANTKSPLAGKMLAAKKDKKDKAKKKDLKDKKKKKIRIPNPQDVVGPGGGPGTGPAGAGPASHQ